MAKKNPDGSYTLTSAEMSEMFSKQSGNQAAEEKSPSMMDKWKQMLAPKKSESKQPDSNTQNKNQAPGGISREAIAERAKSMQFLKPTPEQLEKIQAGDMSAFLEAQQTALQEVFINATLAADSISRHNGEGMRKELAGVVDNRLSSYESAKTIHDKTKNYMNFPGGPEAVSAMTAQFASNNPEATPEDIGTMVDGWFQDFSSNFSKQATEPTGREAAIVEAQRSGADF